MTEAVEKAQKEWIEGMLEPRGEEESPQKGEREEAPPPKQGGGAEPLPKFRCKECGKEFDSWSALMGHTRVHIKEEPEKRGKKEGEPEKKEAERKKIEIPEPPSDQVSIMEEVLSRFSGRNLEVAREPVVELARLKGGMDPMELYSMLVQFGVTDKTARAVATAYLASLQRVQLQNQKQMVFGPTPFASAPSISLWPGVGWQPWPPVQAQPWAQGYGWQPWQAPAQVSPPKPPRTYKIVVEGQEIETDEEGYRAWLKYKEEREYAERERKEWELRMKKLESELSGPPGGKEDDRLAKLEERLEQEREERHKLRIQQLEERIQQLQNRPSLQQEVQYAVNLLQAMGLRVSRGEEGVSKEAPTHSLVREVVKDVKGELTGLRSDLKEIIVQGGGGPFSPKVSRTPEARRREAEELLGKANRVERILDLENQILSETGAT
ncbi:MAG: C2H2-type zinc finger protein [Deltaproteobacteria bacterium]|nr:C2H2-type zinc finger protein [Deltaproteobacteria bacterium]